MANYILSLSPFALSFLFQIALAASGYARPGLRFGRPIIGIHPFLGTVTVNRYLGTYWV
ncbi:hypothetical protein GGR50DRAFT_657656, partial [Xylaria sp. CBS 124048]